MVAIVDSSGRPITARVSELTEPQTARLGALAHEFAEHPTRGLTPARLARILEDAERGDLLAQLDLFEDLEEKDAHIFAELSKRRRALLGLDWQIVAPRNASAAEEAAAEQVSELLADLDIADLILDLGDAIGKSFANLELTWRREAGQWLPSARLQPQRWFQLPQDNAYTDSLRLRDGTGLGQPLQPFGWVTHIHKARPGYLARSGLGRILAWPFLFKNYSLRDLAEFLEIYGLPLRVGTYPAGASEREKATLLAAVVNIGHAAAGIIPEGMAVDFKAAAAGQADPFQAMLDWCERSQSKAILGQTLSAEASATGLGSGVAELQGEVRRDLLVSDARQIANTLTRDLVFPLAMLNIADVTQRQRAPRFEFLTQEPEDLSRYAQAIPQLATVMRIPAQWAHDRLQIPEPKDDEPVLGAAPAPMPAATRAALRTAPAAAATAVDHQAAQLDKVAGPALDDWIDAIRTLVEHADSLQAIRDGLVALYPKMTLDDYAQAMQQALTAAELAGRTDVLAQAGGDD